MSVQLNPSPDTVRDCSPVKGERPGSSLPRPAGRVGPGHRLLLFGVAGMVVLAGCEAGQDTVLTDRHNTVIDVGPDVQWDVLYGLVIDSNEDARFKIDCEETLGGTYAHPDFEPAICIGVDPAVKLEMPVGG